MTTGRKFTPAEKFQIVLELLSPKANVAEMSRRYGIHHSQLDRWKAQALDGMRTALAGSTPPGAAFKSENALKSENARLKKLLAEYALINDRLQETLGGTPLGKNDGGSS